MRQSELFRERHIKVGISWTSKHVTPDSRLVGKWIAVERKYRVEISTASRSNVAIGACNEVIWKDPAWLQKVRICIGQRLFTEKLGRTRIAEIICRRSQQTAK